jgi:hypothetical protein
LVQDHRRARRGGTHEELIPGVQPVEYVSLTA